STSPTASSPSSRAAPPKPARPEEPRRDRVRSVLGSRDAGSASDLRAPARGGALLPPGEVGCLRALALRGHLAGLDGRRELHDAVRNHVLAAPHARAAAL